MPKITIFKICKFEFKGLKKSQSLKEAEKEKMYIKCKTVTLNPIAG